MKKGSRLKNNEFGRCLSCGSILAKIGIRYPLYCPGLECKRAYEHTVRKRQPNRHIKCVFCGCEFTAVGVRRKYCSRECNNNADRVKNSKKPKPKKCKLCSSEFQPYNSLDKFCSTTCRINNMKSKRKYTRPNAAIKVTGENNPCYRNGMYARSAKKSMVGNRLFMKNRDELKQEIIERDGFISCQHCSTSQTYQWETHHIIYRSEKPKHPHLHDKVNLIVLCMKCHNEFHKNKGTRDSIVIERKLNELFGDDVLNKTEFLELKT